METIFLKKQTKGILVSLALVVSLALLSSCKNDNHRQQEELNDTIAFERPLLAFGEVVFAVNVNEDNIMLISSTPADDPNVMPIVNYLNGIFGEAQEDEPSNYWWSADGHNNMFGSTIRLRPLRSEEGGTVIMVY